MDFMKKVNEITQKVGETATETYKTVADKSGKIIEEAKLKSDISKKENEIKVIFETVGRAVYDSYKSGEDVGKAFTKESKKIDKLNSEIEDLNTKILYNKSLRKCSNCGEVIPLNSEYCQNCGDKQKTVKIKDEKSTKSSDSKNEEKAEKVCPQCGIIVEPEAKFCPKCGYKF